MEYLLGGLSAEHRAQLEEALFQDDALSEQLHAAADELIEAYLSGTLSAHDRKRFETQFLTSKRRRERLEFMRALLPAVRNTARAERPSSSWRPWALAAGLLLAATAVALLSEPPRPRIEARVRRAHPALAPTPIASPTAPEPQPPPPVRFVRLASARRPTEVVVPQGTELLRLAVPLPADSAPSYSASLKNSSGKTVWESRDLAPAKAGAPLLLSIPARLLSAAAYRLVISGEVLRDEAGAPPALEFSLQLVRPQPSP